MKKITQTICLFLLFLFTEPAFAQKHLIFLDGYLGWAYSMPPYLTANHEELEKLPYSGFVVNGNVYTSYTLSADPNRNNVTYERVWDEVSSLQGVFKKKTENFLRINLDFPGDFWDDAVWQTATRNFAAVAKAARNLGFKGILFDDEGYASGQHTYANHLSNFKFPKKQDVQANPENYEAWEINESLENRGDWVDYTCTINGITEENSDKCAYRNPEHSFKEHMDKLASRFKTIMQAMQAEYSDITLLVLHGPATAHPKTNIPGHYIKPNSIFETNEYKGAMFLGFKQGLNGVAKLHDMGEFYKYQTNKHFQDSYQWRKFDIVSDQYNNDLDDTYRWVVPQNDRASWPNDTNIGFMVSDYGMKETAHPEYHTEDACRPVDAKERLLKAIDHSDDYVIFYSDSDLSKCDENNPVRWLDIEDPARAEWKTAVQEAYNKTQRSVSLQPAIITFLLNDSQENLPGEAVNRPIYRDAANLPELSGTWHGAMGEHPVRKLTVASPWGAYAANADMDIELFFPADIDGTRPTVFFITGWGMNDSDAYNSLLYFIASQGYNAVFVPYVGGDALGNPDVLLTILDGAVESWNDRIDTSKVGFSGHSSGGGLALYLAQQRPEWGTEGRFLFPIAAWWGYNLQEETGDIQFPPNTNLIVQISHDDPGTDPRQNIDFFLHNNISNERKSFLYIPGDDVHESDHGLVYYKNIYDNTVNYDALDQVGLYRPLESLMRYSFGAEDGVEWKKIGLPDEGDSNFNAMYTLNGISVLSTDTPLANHIVPIPPENELDSRYLCSHENNIRNKMCMPCKDTSRDQVWQQCE